MMSTNPINTTCQCRKNTLEQNLCCICRIVLIRDFSVYPWSWREHTESWQSAPLWVNSWDEWWKIIVKLCAATLHIGVVWSRLLCVEKTCSLNLLQTSCAFMYLCSGGQWGFHLLSSNMQRWLCHSLPEQKRGIFYKIMNHYVCYFPAHTSKMRTFSSY